MRKIILGILLLFVVGCTADPIFIKPEPLPDPRIEAIKKVKLRLVDNKLDISPYKNILFMSHLDKDDIEWVMLSLDDYKNLILMQRTISNYLDTQEFIQDEIIQLYEGAFQ